jgi:hypothetical protein
MASDDERASWRKAFEQSERETLRMRVANPWHQMPDEYRREGEIKPGRMRAIGQFADGR